MNIFKSYKDSKEFLDKQQKIDYLLILTKLLEPGMTDVDSDIKKQANKQIDKIISELK